MRRLMLPLLLLLALTGCGEDLGSGASIVSLVIDPNVVSAQDTGMTDEYFTVTLTFAGFEEAVIADETRVFIQEASDRDAVPGSTTLDGSTITLAMIAKTWVVGLDPGIYDIGAEVRSATESVIQRDLATITIEE